MKLKWTKPDNRTWTATGERGNYRVSRNRECVRGEGSFYWWVPRLNDDIMVEVAGNPFDPCYMSLGDAKAHCQKYEDGLVEAVTYQ